MYVIFFMGDVYLDNSLVDFLRNEGTMSRTPLLVEGQTLDDLAAGTHKVSGGDVVISKTSTGKSRITGVLIDGTPEHISETFMSEPSVSFRSNAARVLYEIREAGHEQLTRRNLMHPHHTGPNSLYYYNFLRDFNRSRGLKHRSTILITDKFINVLGEWHENN
jgi:hypothetical protein